MSLIDEFKKPFKIMDKTTGDDGYGGIATIYKEGATVNIAMTLNNSVEAQVAQKQGVTSIYTATFSKGLQIAYNDYLKRVDDGVYFRITSNPSEDQTPDRMAVQFMKATAERTELPNG